MVAAPVRSRSRRSRCPTSRSHSAWSVRRPPCSGCSALAGIIRPYSPLKLARLGADPAAAGAPAPPAGSPRSRSCSPDRLGVVDELGELTFGEIARAQQRAGRRAARARRRRGRRRRDHVPQPPRLRRRDASPPPSSAPTSSTSTPRSPARSWSTCSSARSPTVVIHDEEFTELLDEADTDATRVLAWVDERRRRRRDTARGADRRRAPTTPTSTRPSSHAGSSSSPPGTTGTPKGAPRSEAGIERRGRAALADAAAPRLAHPHRRAAVPHLGLGAPRAGDAARLDGRAAPQVRPRGLPARRSSRTTCDSLVVIPVMLQRIMQLPQETLRLLRPVDASRWSPRPARRCPATWPSTGWTSSATTSTTSTARPRSPTPRSPRPTDLREAPGIGRQAAVRRRS